MRLNNEAYTVVKDNLIYDSSHPIDSAAVTVSVSAGENGGVILRGEVLDFAEGKYKQHEADGTASAIVAETTSYAKNDTDVTVPVYISGSFRKSACHATPELTDTDVEALRQHGIYVK